MKEYCYCEGCKMEFWLEEEINKRGSLCPNGCPRHQQILLGQTPEEIEIRKKKFVQSDFSNIYVPMDEHRETEILEEEESSYEDERDSDYDSEALIDNMDREILEELMDWTESDQYE